jgi:hypothetical protein
LTSVETLDGKLSELDDPEDDPDEEPDEELEDDRVPEDDFPVEVQVELIEADELDDEEREDDVQDDDDEEEEDEEE